MAFNFGNLFSRGINNTNTNLFNQAFYSMIGGGLTTYDYTGHTYLEKGYNINADVFSIVSQISRKFGSVPAIFKSGDKEVSNPLPKPNYYQSETEFKELWETFMLLNGNAYQWILSPKEGANSGVPMARFLLPSHLIQIVLKDNVDFEGTESPIDHYLLVMGNAWIRFEAEDIIHSKFPNPNYDLHGSHLYGRSPLAAANIDIQTQNVTKEGNLKAMNNGGVYGFIHAKDGQTPLTAPQAAELKERLLEMQASKGVLSQIAGASAPLGFTKISVDTKDLLPFEYLKYSQKQLCNVLGWSDKLLNNDDGAKYDNLIGAWKMSISNRIAPDLNIYQEGLNDQFYSRWKGQNITVSFDVSSLSEMQEDMKTLADWMSVLLDKGVINRDDVRYAFKFPTLGTPEMQQFTVQSGVIPIEDIGMNDQAVSKSFNLDA